MQYAAQMYPPMSENGQDDDDMDALRNGPPPPPAASTPTDDIEAQVHAELAALRAPARNAHVLPLDTDTECCT